MKKCNCCGWDDEGFAHEPNCSSLLEKNKKEVESLIRKKTILEVIEKLYSMKNEISELLYGFDGYPKTDEQAEAVIKIIINNI